MRTILFILFIGLFGSCVAPKQEVVMKVDLPIPYVGPISIDTIQ